MPQLTLTSLTVFPIKSAGGIAVRQWPVDDFGLRYDRRWMVVDRAGQALTQREHPRLALVRPEIVGERLRVAAPGLGVLELELDPAPAVPTTAEVWGDTCASWWMGETAAAWFTRLLGATCSLVYMPAETRRPADPDYAPPGVRVSYADAFPFLLISEESLADLNRRLPDPLPMNRFRPNLVVAGGGAYLEDALQRFWIGGIEFQAVKPCARCVLTTTDQDTADRGPEPLRTLATYRRVGGQVLFGRNLLHLGTGTLRVGDPVQMQNSRPR